jgi:F0F1-type ATP synthase membrane subunit c/vacuolar-type H+-ATPase subunit K
MQNFVILFVMFLTILGPLFVITVIGFTSINALGRHPSAAPKILPRMLIRLVLVETAGIGALLALLRVFGTSQ